MYVLWMQACICTLMPPLHWDFGANLQLSLLVAAVASTCAAAGLLAGEFFASRRLVRIAPGIFAAALAAFVAVGALLDMPAWLATGSGCLAAVLLGAWLLQFEPVLSRLARLAQPKAAWAGLLFLSLVASRFLAANVLNSIQPQLSPAEIDLADVPVLATQAVTDKGRGISLFHFKMHSASAEIQKFVAQNEKDRAQLIRLLESNPASNCYGWVFTRGQYGIRDAEVPIILSDNEYVEISQPQDGDLVVYRRGDDICHCGVVRIVDRHAPVLVESKWGPFGVYLHAPSTQPFGGDSRFYRSARPNHMLALRAADNNRATVSIIAPAAQLP